MPRLLRTALQGDVVPVFLLGWFVVVGVSVSSYLSEENIYTGTSEELYNGKYERQIVHLQTEDVFDLSFEPKDLSLIRNEEHSFMVHDRQDLSFLPPNMSLASYLGMQEGTGSSSKDQRFVHLFFITYHGSPKPETNNLHVYAVDADSEQTSFDPHGSIHIPYKKWKPLGAVLDLDTVKGLNLQNLRGVVSVGDAVFIASAHSSTSKIVTSTKCGARPRKAKIFTANGLAHPYGIAFFRGRIFATNQNDDSVVSFALEEAGEKKFPKAHKFATVKNPRGLAFDTFGRVWVASTKTGLHIFTTEGEEIGRMKITHAVGVAMNRLTGIVYVGSVDGKKNSAIYGIDTRTMKVVETYQPPKHHKLSHPAGIVVHALTNTMFVVAQKERVVYAFKLGCPKKQCFMGVVLDNLPDKPEQMALWSCASTT